MQQHNTSNTNINNNMSSTSNMSNMNKPLLYPSRLPHQRKNHNSQKKQETQDNDRIITSSISPWGRGAQFQMTTIGKSNSDVSSSSSSSSSTPNPSSSQSSAEQASSSPQAQAPANRSLRSSTSTVLRYLLSGHGKKQKHRGNHTSASSSAIPPNSGNYNKNIQTPPSLSISPMFGRICWLGVCTILGLAATLTVLAQNQQRNTDHSAPQSMFALRGGSQNNHQQQLSNNKKKNRQLLHEYFLEHGVEEPIYIASTLEHYLLQQGAALGWNETMETNKKETTKPIQRSNGNFSSSLLAAGCRIWTNPHEAIVHPELYHLDDKDGSNTTNNTESQEELEAMSVNLRRYRQELQRYQQALADFEGYRNKSTHHDIRRELTENDEQDYDICQKLEVPPIIADNGGQRDDLQANFFASTSRLSSPSSPDHTLLSKTLQAGWMEPLITPMRHPDFCFQKTGNYANIQYLVHDFAHICRSQLRPKSRVVLLDLTGSRAKFATEVKLVRLYRKFGIPVDHVLAFEYRSDDMDITPNETAATNPTSQGATNTTTSKKRHRKDSFRLAPRQLQAAADLNIAYHFRTATAETILDPTHPQNPLQVLQQEYTPNDLILLKIDMDDPKLELALVRDQILQQPALWPLIDQLYFEHHVHMREMAPSAWKPSSMGGTILDSLQLFSELRSKGIGAHFWV